MLLASLICLIPVVIGFIVPVTALLLDAVAEGDALDAARLVSLISNTLLVALIAAGICVTAAVWLAMRGAALSIRSFARVSG